MSEHIDEQRLMEIALGAAVKTPADEMHLAQCIACNEALAAEAEVSAMLATVPQQQAPTFLAARIDRAYVSATSSSRAPWIALAATAVLLVPLLALLATHWTDVVSHLSSWTVAARAVAGIVMRGSGPAMVAVQAVLLLAGLGVLMRLFDTTALEPSR